MKKRSIGVTIFGWWCIICGALGIFSFPIILLMAKLPPSYMYPNNIFIGQCSNIFYILYLSIATIANLVAGIGLLKLKSWARKLVIILCLAGMVYSISFSVKMMMNSSQFIEASLSANALPKNSSPGTIEAMKAFMQVILVGSMVVGISIGIGFLIFIIWFFNRKSVVEQFEVDNKVSAMEQK